MIDRPKVLFRADGNGSIGLGHLIRSSALAGILKDKYSCALATRSKNEAVLEQVSPSFTKLIQLPEGDYLEEANFLAINLANDIVKGKMDANSARDFYAKAVKDMINGGKPEYMQKLQFDVASGNTEDLDKSSSIITEADMKKAKEMMEKQKAEIKSMGMK